MNDIFDKIAELKKRREAFALAIVVRQEGSVPGKVGAKMIVLSSGKPTAGTVGGGAVEKKITADCMELLKQNKNALLKYDLSSDLGMKCGGMMEVFVESFAGNAARLVICGGGHIAQKLGPMAAIAGLSYAVIDDRPEFASKELFPSADEIISASFEDAFLKIKMDADTYVAIVTYKHLHDEFCLKKALESGAKYVGMIGSRKKVSEIFKNLGIKNDPRVFAPVGLDLGDGSPEEIAVSILSEILKIKSGGSGAHKRAGA
ncbi:MAG: XdhC/CoxI family protein [Endomicrobiia bacterium]|nr:XdhC/CoxI family protein [Endomicrobiia bacterium]